MDDNLKYDTLTAGMADTSDDLNMHDVVDDEDETFGSGDQAAGDYGHPNIFDQISRTARREPLAALAAAVGLGVVIGFLLGR